MDEKEKLKLLKQFKNRENGDINRDDNDLVKSESYMTYGQKEKSKYKEFYDDVKLSVKEDW